MNVDILAIAAHRDDIEITCAGTLIKMIQQGYSAAILDLTKGEMGTRGTAESRTHEATKAAKIMGVIARKNLGLPDAFLEETRATRIKVAAAIREFSPTIILAPYWDAHHPDHAVTGRLVRDAVFTAGLAKLETGTPAHRTPRVLYYSFRHMDTPAFVVDTTHTFALKMDAIKAYESQFYNPESKEPETWIARKEFLTDIEAKDRYFGSLISTQHGEPFMVRGAIKVPDIVDFFKDDLLIR